MRKKFFGRIKRFASGARSKAAAFSALYLSVSASAGAQEFAMPSGLTSFIESLKSIFTGPIVKAVLIMCLCGCAVAYGFNKDNEKMKRNVIAIAVAIVIIMGASWFVGKMFENADFGG